MTAARKHDPEASRAAILEAAAGLFLERGFAGASMSEIARASGVTKSLIHHHFGSKDALWADVKKATFAEYHAKQMKLFDEQAATPELMQQSMVVYFKELRRNPNMMRLMYWMLLERAQDCSDQYTELRDSGIERIELAQKAGIIRNDVPPLFILMTFLGFVHAWFREPELVDAPVETEDAYLDACWKIFTTGVLAKPA